MILTGQYDGKGWTHHPVVRMWSGFETALAVYGLETCAEWRNRGYKDSLLPYFTEQLNRLSKTQVGNMMPSWFGMEAFHASHRAALLAKNPKYYQQFGWAEKPEIAYVWPVPLKKDD